MQIPLPRAIAHKEFATAAIAKAEEMYPLFGEVWSNAILPLICADTERRVLVEEHQPPRYVLAFREWKVAGIPHVRVTYRCPEDKAEPIVIESVVLSPSG